ncbi:11089_t:CDS:2, partial [Acaulospora morrowiae]
MRRNERFDEASTRNVFELYHISHPKHRQEKYAPRPKKRHYFQECLENVPPVPVAPTAENSIPNVHYCEWQLEKENGMDVYVAEGNMPAKIGRPKCKPESSLGKSSHVPKIRRVVDLVKLIEISIQPMEKEISMKKIKRKKKLSDRCCNIQTSEEIYQNSYDNLLLYPKLFIYDLPLPTPKETDISDEDPDTCDEFKYESKELEEKVGYYMKKWSDEELYKNLWKNIQNSAIYMTTLEEIPILDEDQDKHQNDEETLKQNIDIRLTKEEQEEATTFFEKKKDLFAKNIMELIQTN